MNYFLLKTDNELFWLSWHVILNKLINLKNIKNMINIFLQLKYREYLKVHTICLSLDGPSKIIKL
jgi:hypothetical protein